jgi:hypothetical protein
MPESARRATRTSAERLPLQRRHGHETRRASAENAPMRLDRLDACDTPDRCRVKRRAGNSRGGRELGRARRFCSRRKQASGLVRPSHAGAISCRRSRCRYRTAWATRFTPSSSPLSPSSGRRPPGGASLRSVAETLVSCVPAPSRMRSFARAAVPRAMNESTAGAQPGPMAGKTGPWRTVLSRG